MMSAGSVASPFPRSVDVVVCGSGPAGLSAALAAVQSRASVLLLERMPRFGVKLCASGGGRCNLSNVLDPVSFMQSFGRSGRFLSESLAAAPRQWLCDFLRHSGVSVSAPDGFHYFPDSGRAADLLNVFLAAIRSGDSTLRAGAKLDAIQLNNGHLVSVTVDGVSVPCRALVLACGGMAMSRLGGTNSGMELAKSAGHSIVKPLPAMAPLYLAEEWPRKLSGVSLPDVELAFAAGRSGRAARGELLFTFDGISGPAAIDLSGPAAAVFYQRGELELTLNFDASCSLPGWSERLAVCRAGDPEKLVQTALARWFPKSLAEQIAEVCGFAQTRMKQLNKSGLEHLARALFAMPLHLSKLSPLEKAMAMKGGVSLKEVDPKTMSSRLVPGLYFAGELLDLDGPCGGYNIQAAFSTGRLAGLSAAGFALSR